LANLAKPGNEPVKRPYKSHLAKSVIQTSLVPAGSHHTVDSVMLENNLV